MYHSISAKGARETSCARSSVAEIMAKISAPSSETKNPLPAAFEVTRCLVLDGTENPVVLETKVKGVLTMLL